MPLPDSSDLPVRFPRRRKPGPKANPFWRFVFPVLLLGTGYWVFLLWHEGTDAVLNTTDGQLVEIVADPSQPGYQAFVDPTPTMLVAHTSNGELAGVTVLARTLLDGGGELVLVNTELVPNPNTGVTLAELYAREGLAGLEEVVGQLFDFGFTERDVVTTEELGQLLDLVAPIPFALADDLVRRDGEGIESVWLARGGQQLDGSVAAELYPFRNPVEAEANRIERQADLWESWLTRIDQSEDPLAATPSSEDGLAPYLRAFAAGVGEVQVLPATPTVEALTAEALTADAMVYTLAPAQEAWLSDIASMMVPVPIRPLGVDRAAVRLLDGTGDATTATAAREAVTDLGVEVVVIGNANEFGITTTTVTYFKADDQRLAEELATALDGMVRFEESMDQPVDLTVLIGTDWVPA